MSGYRWKRADESDIFLHCPNHLEKYIFYPRVYTPGGGYAHSETNQLILNLKAEPDSSAGRLRYKAVAIEKFAAEVAAFLSQPQRRQHNMAIVPAPTRHTEVDPDYDDRLVRVAKKIEELVPNVKYIPLLRRSRTVGAQHSSATRGAESVYQSVKIDLAAKAKMKEFNVIVVLDDVTTSGATFEGCRRRIEEELPGQLIVGIFWAKAE